MYAIFPRGRSIPPLKAAILLLLLSFLLSGTLSAQTVPLTFDSTGGLSSFPLSRAFEKKSVQLTLDVKEPTRIYLQQLHDSLVAKAGKMKTFLLTPETIAFYSWLFSPLLYDSTDSHSFYSQFLQWEAYVKTPSSTGPPPGAWFPAFPTAAQIQDSAWWVYSHNNKVKKRLDATDPLLIIPTGPWVAPGFHREVRFKLVLKDVWQQSVIDRYNGSLTREIRKLNSDSLLSWRSRLDSLLLFARRVGKTLRNDRIQFADASCLIDSVHQIEDSLNKNPLVKFLRTNTDFFLSWLWLNDGQLTIDPFPFTAAAKLPKTLSKSDKLNRARSQLFDSLYKKLGKLADSDIARIYKDTLTIRDIAKQQNRGKDYFKSDDSLQATQRNKDQLASFLALRQNIYSFRFPYQMPDDSIIALQQFDAAASFTRVDRLSDGSSQPTALRKILAKIPDTRMAVVVTHNVPITTRLTFAEFPVAIPDQGGFQKALNDSTFSGIASLASLFTSSTFLNLFSFIPTQPIIPAKTVNYAPPEPAHARGQAKNRNTGSAPLTPDQCQDSLENELKAAFTKIVDDTVRCAGEFIRDQAKAMAQGAAHCQLALNNPVWFNRAKTLFVDALNTRIKEVNIVRSQLIDTLSKDTLVAIANLLSIGQFLAPPDQLKADNVSLSDSSLFATQILYLKQASSLNRDNYILYTTGPKPKDSAIAVATGQFSKAPRHFFSLGFGVAYTFHKIPLNTVTTTNNQLSITQDLQAERLVVGVHIYPGKIFNLDDRFFIHRPTDGSLHYGVSTWSRLSIFLGMGIPGPLHNYYTGLSADLVPGLKLHTGPQWLWYTKYQIFNDQVAGQQSGLRYGGWYLALNVDPSGVISTLISQFK